MILKKQVIAGFNQGAATYDQVASLQQRVAYSLAKKISSLHAKNILEIGCGTGILSEKLTQLFPHSQILLTDIAPKMLELCQQRFSDNYSVSFSCMDGENLQHTQLFDLITSSMTLHWFNDFNHSLEKITQSLQVGGRFLFAMLGQDSLIEWRNICGESHVIFPMPAFPSLDELTRQFPNIKLQSEIMVETHDNLSHFLTTLKLLGAVAPRQNYSPLSPGKMRHLLRCYDHKLEISYQIIYGEYCKS